MASDRVMSLAVDPEEEYLSVVESSSCLLLATPSPTPTPFHPLTDINLMSPDEPRSEQLHTGDGSSSSGSSASVALPQDPVSAQLINNISMLEYQSLTKTDHSVAAESGECKVKGIVNGNGRPLPSLVKWNWGLVRSVVMWAVVAALVACIAAVVGMLATIPKSCRPRLPWYHGTVFYEVFTASFEDSNNDAFGDLRGLTNKLDYIENLGVKAIRLNFIFEATEYPEHYAQVTNATKVAPEIGTMKDFQNLVERVHQRNMSILLDVPAAILLRQSTGGEDALARTLAFWSSLAVDGFYLKDVESIIDDPRIERGFGEWKRDIGSDKILMISNEAFVESVGKTREALLSAVDLIDVSLKPNGSVEDVRRQIEEMLSGPLFSEPTHPWVHWNAGSVESARLAVTGGDDATALLLLALSLPGSVGIFYGDEIGLRGLPPTSDREFPEHRLVRALVAMRWHDATDGGCQVSAGGELPWNCGVEQPDFARADIVAQAVKLRRETPTLYVARSVSDGAWRSNAETRAAAAALVVSRWLPRRHSYVLLANLAPTPLRADLSSAFYIGVVVAATNATSVGNTLRFDRVVMSAHEALIVQLDK